MIVPTRQSDAAAVRQTGAMAGKAQESRHGVSLTNLDQPLFSDAGATKRQLVDYLDGVAERIIPTLRDRPLSVIRVQRDEAPFMQKNLPKYAPDWVERVTLWAESSKRDVSYALCNDVRTLIWFGNQRAIEYHPTLIRINDPERVTDLVLDLDPPGGAAADGFSRAVDVAILVREALRGAGLDGAVKSSGAKGVHVFVPVDVASTSIDDAAAATRAIAGRAAALDPKLATTEFVKERREGKVFVDATRVGGATVVSAYSPRARPGVPVSFPLRWEDLTDADPGDFTVHTALERLGERDPWAELLPAPQRLDAALVAEGHEIPVGRVQAMHEGKRRARARREADG